LAEQISPVQRARTLQEQTLVGPDDNLVEDEKFRYVRYPLHSDEDEMKVVQLIRRGYEVAEGHRGNDAKHVMLRMPKDRHMQEYLEACAKIRSYNKEEDAKSPKFKGKSIHATQEVKPGLIDDFAERLPDEDDEIA